MEKPRKHQRRRDSAWIPLDLMTEILTRLPAKSLMKFKCLSKQYASIIESQNFVDSYSSKQRPGMLFGIHNDEEITIYSATTHSNEEPSTTTIIPRQLMTIPDNNNDMVPVRGLICYSTRPNQHVICNLATGQLLHLPPNESWKEEEEVEDFDEYMFFGYEPISNRFKVISILTCWKVGKSTEQQFWILTVGDEVKKESWRKIEDLPYLPGVFLEPRPLGTTCINGVLYYSVQSQKIVVVDGDDDDDDDEDEDEDDDDDDRLLRVVSFDLKTEKFNLIEVADNFNNNPKLFDFQGKLACLERFGDTSICMWVLENAEKHEWSQKIFKLPLTSINLELRQLGLFGICENNIVFWQHEFVDQLFTYHFDLDKKTIRKVQIQMPWKWTDFVGFWRYYSANHTDNVVLL